MEFVVPQHSRTKVRNAGKLIGEATGTEEELREARDILSNFRSAHALPLNAVTTTVRKKTLREHPNAIVAQRLKRLPTILDKLKREPTMNVTTMQDLGGCRVVLESISEVAALVLDLLDVRRAKNRVSRVYDYIYDEPGPKSTGYRGVHLAYTYRASKDDYHGMRIELQVRTKLQHAWSTAVETMDLFSGSELKYGKGEQDEIRFFVIVSSLMADKEGTTRVPGAEQPVGELIEELRGLERKRGIVSRLENYKAIVSDHAMSNRRSALTLELKRSAQELNVMVHERMASAEARLAELEGRDDSDLDVVLVNIQKIGQLQAAYPNYFADTAMFTDFVLERIKP